MTLWMQLPKHQSIVDVSRNLDLTYAALALAHHVIGGHGHRQMFCTIPANLARDDLQHL